MQTKERPIDLKNFSFQDFPLTLHICIIMCERLAFALQYIMCVDYFRQYIMLSVYSLCVFCSLQYEEFHSEKLLSLLPIEHNIPTYTHTHNYHMHQLVLWYWHLNDISKANCTSAFKLCLWKNERGRKETQQKLLVLHPVGQSFILKFIVHFALTLLPL